MRVRQHYCVAEGLAGVECLSGIPGLAGATPVQNVGAYGQDVSETIVGVTVWDRELRSLVQMAPAECGFAYRDSLFKRNPRYVVTEVVFRLRRSRFSTPLRYEELARRLGAEIGDSTSLEETARAVIELRKAKGMVLEPTDPDSRSVGSFFTNPVLDDAPGEGAFAPRPRRAQVPSRGGHEGTCRLARGTSRVCQGLPQRSGGHLGQARTGSDGARRRHCGRRAGPGQGCSGRRAAALWRPAGARTGPGRPPSLTKIRPLTNDYGADRFLRV